MADENTNKIRLIVCRPDEQAVPQGTHANCFFFRGGFATEVWFDPKTKKRLQ